MEKKRSVLRRSGSHGKKKENFLEITGKVFLNSKGVVQQRST